MRTMVVPKLTERARKVESLKRVGFSQVGKLVPYIRSLMAVLEPPACTWMVADRLGLFSPSPGNRAVAESRTAARRMALNARAMTRMRGTIR